jgi:AcrR family transcriptional regulator
MAARILDAARASFAAEGWAGTTIRAVARSAGVDPALIYHYFGSKERLLDAATDMPAEWADGIRLDWATPPDRLGEALVRGTLRNWSDERFRPLLLATLLTASHEPRTRAKIARIFSGVLMAPALERLDADQRARRASLAASQLLGMIMMREVWRVDPIASMAADQLVAAVGPIIQHYLTGPLD